MFSRKAGNSSVLVAAEGRVVSRSKLSNVSFPIARIPSSYPSYSPLCIPPALTTDHNYIQYRFPTPTTTPPPPAADAKLHILHPPFCNVSVVLFTQGVLLSGSLHFSFFLLLLLLFVRMRTLHFLIRTARSTAALILPYLLPLCELCYSGRVGPKTQ